MRFTAVSILLLFGVLVAAAAPRVALTVYNQNLAFVRDIRPIEFKKGAGEILFKDVSAQIDPTSVHFAAPGVDMLEQNYDYDLVSPDKLLEKYVDNTIEIVTRDGSISRGTLLTSIGGTDGQVVLRLEDGTLKSVRIPENVTEFRYPSLPQGLITRPTLRWLVNSDAAQSKDTELSYLTTGLSWHAEYVLLLNEANTNAGLNAWVTVENTCGTSFENAQLKLMAGEIHRAQPPARPDYRMMDMMSAKAAGGAEFAEQKFFEYHLYTLQRPTTLASNQTKQLSLFPATSLAIRKIYEYDWQRDNERVSVSAEFDNKQENGLGIALPAGKVRVYQQSGPDGQEFIGEDNIEHTPKNEKVTVEIGKAFDIVAERAQMDYRRISDRVSETDFSVKLRNHKSDAVEVVVLEHFYGDWEITKSSLPSKKISASKVEFRVAVQPEQEVNLTYTVRNR